MRRVSYNLILAFCSVLAIFLLWKGAVAPGKLPDHVFSPEPSENAQHESFSVDAPGMPIESLSAESHLDTQDEPVTPNAPDRMIVIGRLSSENVDWVAENLQDWDSTIYTVDNTSAPIHTDRNKGREANAYLTFIIEHYDKLPKTSVFVHSHRSGFPEAWHTDSVHHDMVIALESLNIDHIQEEGYVNLRCNPDPGCYGMIVQPRRHENDTGDLNRDAASELAWLDAWPHLKFTNEDEVPFEIGAACCAQFAVSRDQILKRPLEDYVRYHKWLMDTEMSDEISGRVMEYSWHMMFGKDPIHCPEIMECYMNLYPGKNPYGIDGNGEAIQGPDPQGVPGTSYEYEVPSSEDDRKGAAVQVS